MMRMERKSNIVCVEEFLRFVCRLWRKPLQEAKQFLEKLIGGESSPRRVCRSPHLGLLELAAQSDRHQLQMDNSNRELATLYCMCSSLYPSLSEITAAGVFQAVLQQAMLFRRH